jgi:hypothetical protein
VSPDALRALLEQVARQETSVDGALAALETLPFEDLGFANVDHHRALRTGVPEMEASLRSMRSSAESDPTNTALSIRTSTIRTAVIAVESSRRPSSSMPRTTRVLSPPVVMRTSRVEPAPLASMTRREFIRMSLTRKSRKSSPRKQTACNFEWAEWASRRSR